MTFELFLRYLDIFLFTFDFSSDVYISMANYFACHYVFTMWTIVLILIPGIVLFVDEKINRRKSCSFSLFLKTIALPVVTVSVAFQSLLNPEDHLLRVKYSTLREYEIGWESLPQYCIQLFLLCRIGLDTSNIFDTAIKIGILILSFTSIWK